jgi:hypothetical protein
MACSPYKVCHWLGFLPLGQSHLWFQSFFLCVPFKKSSLCLFTRPVLWEHKQGGSNLLITVLIVSHLYGRCEQLWLQEAFYKNTCRPLMHCVKCFSQGGWQASLQARGDIVLHFETILSHRQMLYGSWKAWMGVDEEEDSTFLWGKFSW